MVAKSTGRNGGGTTKMVDAVIGIVVNIREGDGHHAIVVDTVAGARGDFRVGDAHGLRIVDVVIVEESPCVVAPTIADDCMVDTP